ncbi:MAG: LysR family transcriptional regulator [Lachnospiraceae bacterium]
MLDFRTETFLTVCEYMNYTKAAEALNLTQPAISGHMKYLEEYYGVKLFLYENKKLLLTQQGEYLRRALQTQVHDEKKLKDELLQMKPCRIYRIGATLSIGDSYLPKLLPGYMEKHPETELAVTVANTASLLKQLDRGDLDIVLSEGYFFKNDYEYRRIREEKLSIFCGAHYDASKIKSLKKLFEHRLISREPGSGTRAVLEHFLLEKGFSIDNFTQKCEFSSLPLILEMLMANQGISVLYHCVGEELLREGRLKEIKIKDFCLRHDFHALWQKNSMYGMYNEQFLRELYNEEK